MTHKRFHKIQIWPGVLPGLPDPTTHFWYEGLLGERLRLCDDVKWDDEPWEPQDFEPYVPCRPCKELYAQDVLAGKQLLEPIPWDPTGNGGDGEGYPEFHRRRL